MGNLFVKYHYQLSYNYIVKCRSAEARLKTTEQNRFFSFSAGLSIQVFRRINIKFNMSGTFQPIVMSGPSGSGKSTLVKKLMAEYDGCFAFSVSREAPLKKI